MTTIELPTYEPPQGTKLVGVNLAALTRQQWYGLVEVPEGMDIDEVVEKLNAEIDGGEYEDDFDYWEKGHCYAEVELELDPTDRPQFKIADDGTLCQLTIISQEEEEEEETHTEEEVAAFGTEDDCPKSPDTCHRPDWSTANIQHDGDGVYVDVNCQYCGRSGCVGNLPHILENLSW